MKNKAHILITIIVYIILMLFVAEIYLPSRNLNIDDMSRDSEGNIYATECENNIVFVYKMDAYGKALDVYRCKAESDEVETFCEYSNNDTYYIMQVWNTEGEVNFSVWSKKASDKVFKYIWSKSLASDIKIEGFNIANNETVCVSGIDLQTEDIVLYYWEDKTEYVVQYNTDFTPVSVSFGESDIYCLSHDNKVYCIDLDGKKHDMEIDNADFLCTDDKGIFYQEKGKKDITYLYFDKMAGHTFYDIGDVWNIQNSEKARNTSILLYNDERDRLLIVDQNGKNANYIDSFDLNLGQKLQCIGHIVCIFTLVYIAIIIIIILFNHFIWSKRRLLYQTMAYLVGLTGIWLIATLTIIYIDEIKVHRQDRLFLADTSMTTLKSRLLEGWNIANFDYNNYIGSDSQNIIEQIFFNGEMKNSWQTFFVREELIYGVENPVFVFSEESAFGSVIDTLYNTDAIKNIKKCMLNGEPQKFIDKVNGVSYAFSVTGIGIDSKQLYLVSRVPLLGIEGVYNKLFPLFVITLLSWIFVMVILWLILKNKWGKISQLVVQMEKVSRGDYHIQETNVPANEFGTMWTCLERMCKNLQIQKYRNDNILDYVYKFAPRNFERLFSKERLQDIEIGENIKITGTMGLISVINKELLLSGKVDRHYIEKQMQILFSQSEFEQAVFIQNGSTLENVKAVFKEDDYSVMQAVKYGITCMEILTEKVKSEYETKPFILLHNSQFVCGLGGGDKQLYPYVTSLEFETLNNYVDDLKNCGVRIAVTEGVWLQVREHLQGRYIGYVKSSTGQHSFKLYEILDACPQIQKISKIKNKENFEKALQLYYDNDLYLARSLFADILKECPEDGIAKWYIFACDELFNQGAASNANYELFLK